MRVRLSTPRSRNSLLFLGLLLIGLAGAASVPEIGSLERSVVGALPFAPSSTARPCSPPG